jgi:molybdenum cofactor guanylyltransferase
VANAKGITGLIIAGGKSTRMGGNNKALRLLNGRPMIEWVIDRIRPQIDDLMINTNSNQNTLAALGYPIVTDIIPNHRGPLAGLHAAMTRATTSLIACVPCDAPLLPIDLIARLHAVLANADIAVARTPASLQPAFLLCRTSLGQSIEEYLAEGRYAMRHWMARHHCVEVNFGDEEAFANINTPADIQNAEVLLMRTVHHNVD